MMRLKESTAEKLSAWLGPSTWHTGHPADMNRWYAFVDQYQRDHGFTIDEAELRNYIVEIAKCENNECLREVITENIQLAYKILDFLKHTKR